MKNWSLRARALLRKEPDQHRRSLAVLAVLALYLATRTPFLAHPLIAEEGMYAYMVAVSPEGPRYNLVGMVRGQPCMEHERHPAGSCAVYTYGGRAMRALLTLLDPAALRGSAWIRLFHSAFQGLLWLLLAWRFGALRGGRALAVVAVASLFFLSPLGVGASVLLRSDTSTGLLLGGLASLALLRPSASGPPWAAAAAGAMLGALGKQEWGIGAALGLLGGLALAALAGGAPRRCLRPVAWMAAAAAAGNILSWSLDRENYEMGWRAMRSIGPQYSLFTPGQGGRWLDIFRYRLPQMAAYLLVLALSTAVLVKRGARGREGLCLGLGLAWGLFAPFFLSTWSGEYRFFAPAWAALLPPSLALAGEASPGAAARRALFAAALLLGLAHLAFLGTCWAKRLSVTEKATVAFDFFDQSSLQMLSQSRGCVPQLPIGWALEHGIADFMGFELAREDAARKAEKMGAALCP